jgi:calcineurin-like phosphoesterase family protein
MALFFTSDHHFGHGGARGLFKRPFGSLVEMDEGMIARWNEAVRADDEVWHLGDQSATRMPELLEALAGRKHLIIGNNDGAATVGLAAWTSVQHYAELEVNGAFLVLCHYSLRSWNRMTRGALNLHSQATAAWRRCPARSTLASSAGTTAPVTLAEIREHLAPRPRRTR